MSESPEEASSGALDDGGDEWMKPSEVYRLFRRGATWLRSEKIPHRPDPATGGRLWLKAKILERLAEEADDEPSGGGRGRPSPKDEAEAEVAQAIAQNVKAAGDMLRQVLAHHEKMFVAYERAQGAVLDRLIRHTEGQNGQILTLESYILEMRSVAEKAMSLEHERKLAEQQSERSGRIKEEAWKGIQSSLLPWLGPFLGKKLNLEAPGAAGAAAPNGTASHSDQVGKFTIQVLSALSDEDFEKMRATLPDEVGQALAALRLGVKEGSIKA